MSALPAPVECTICLSNIDFLNSNFDDKPNELDCNHFFHNHCIISWVKEGSNCPNCRVAIPEDTLQKLKLQDDVWIGIGPIDHPVEVLYIDSKALEFFLKRNRR